MHKNTRMHAPAPPYATERPLPPPNAADALSKCILSLRPTKLKAQAQMNNIPWKMQMETYTAFLGRRVWKSSQKQRTVVTLNHFKS